METMIRVLTKELEIERTRNERLEDENMRLRQLLNVANAKYRAGHSTAQLVDADRDAKCEKILRDSGLIDPIKDIGG